MHELKSKRDLFLRLGMIASANRIQRKINALKGVAA
jgi:hypothetical protein